MNFEREIVHALQELGLSAEKIPLSGAAGGSFTGDISVPVQGEDWRLECKRRKRSFVTVYQCIGDNKAVVIRDDHTPALVVMPLETFAKLAKVVR